LSSEVNLLISIFAFDDPLKTMREEVETRTLVPDIFSHILSIGEYDIEFDMLLREVNREAENKLGEKVKRAKDFIEYHMSRTKAKDFITMLLTNRSFSVLDDDILYYILGEKVVENITVVISESPLLVPYPIRRMFLCVIRHMAISIYVKLRNMEVVMRLLPFLTPVELEVIRLLFAKGCIKFLFGSREAFETRLGKYSGLPSDLWYLPQLFRMLSSKRDYLFKDDVTCFIESPFTSAIHIPKEKTIEVTMYQVSCEGKDVIDNIAEIRAMVKRERYSQLCLCGCQPCHRKCVSEYEKY